MKKARHNRLRTSLLSAALAFAMAVSVFAADSGVITDEVVNVRKGPGTGYEVVEMLAKGRTVTVLGEESGWYHIQWNDSTGYVRNDYLAVNGKAPAKAADATVSGGSAINVRSGPGTDYSRVTMVAEGKRVAILKKSGDWYYVAFDGTAGYILSDYVTPDGSGTSAKPAGTPAQAAGASAGNATVSGGDTINVRSGPDTSYSRVTRVSRDKRVTILEKNGSWYHVSFDGTTGYILSDYVTPDSGVSIKTAETPAKPKPVDTSVGNATVSGGDTINVRSGPDTTYSRVTRVGEGKRVTLLTEEGGWFKVSFDGKTGYIFGDFLTPDNGALEALAAAEASAAPTAPAVEAMAPAPATEASSAGSDFVEARTAYITGGTINVRTGPGTEFDRVTLVSTGKQIDVLGEDNGWFKVSFGSTIGYVLGEYVTDKQPPAAGVGEQIASLAAQYLGVRYVYGGASTNGFDCSGFTMWLYKQYGYSLPHTASGQYANCGYKVSRSDLQPGDLVFFSSPGSGGRINHVGVYVGGGGIIHARYSIGKVYRNSLSESYYSTYYAGAIRIV